MLTQQQMSAATAKYFPTQTATGNTPNATVNAGLRGAAAVQARQQASTAQPEDHDGVIMSFIKSVANHVAKFGVSAYNTVQSAADVAYGQGDKAQADLDKTRDIPILGKVEPVIKSTDTAGQILKKGAANALELAATFGGGGAAADVVKSGAKGALKTALKTGLKEGAAFGGAQGAGSALDENKGVGGVLADTAGGALTGAALGSILSGLVTTLSPTARQEVLSYMKSKTNEAVSSAVNKVGGAVKGVVEKASENPLVKTAGTVAKDLYGKTKDFVEKAPERAAVNDAERQAQKEALAKFAPNERAAVENGVDPRHVELLKTMTPQEQEVFGRMHQNAQDFHVDEMAQDPASTVGHELQNRVRGLEDLKDKMGQAMGDMAAKVKEAPDQNGVRRAVFDRLREVPGLKGLGLDLTDKENPLKFERTLLGTGKSTESDRNAIIQEFNDLIGKDNEQLHLKRQELFEVLGGKKSSLQQMTDTQDKAYQAIRQGLADVLEKAVPGYRDANMNFAKVADNLRNVRKFIKGIPGATGDVLDERAGSLARRLTSNAPSGADLKNLLGQAESLLKEHGVNFNTNVTKLQKLYNMLSSYYDLTKDTGLAGQVKLGTMDIPTSIKGVAGHIADEVKNMAGVTKTVRMKALEDFIKSLK